MIAGLSVWTIVTMRKLFSLLWTDRVGSTLSAEMALVTSVTVGALFMSMAEFSRTINREFQNSTHQVGLAGTEQSIQENEEETVIQKKKPESEKTPEEKAEDERKRNEWRARQEKIRRDQSTRD